MKYDAPLIITGSPRSGTTALQFSLSALPGVCIWYEFELYNTVDHPYDIIVDRVERLNARQGDGPWTWPELRAKPMRLRNPIAYNTSLVDVLASIKDAGPEASLETLRYVAFQHHKGSLRLYGDKTPRAYCTQIPEVLEEYPDAKLIYCVRDGRDVAASRMHRDESALFAANEWMEQIECLEAALRYPDIAPRILVVKLEEGAQDTGAVFDHIAAFTELEVIYGDRDTFRNFYKPCHIGRWRKDCPNIEAEAGEGFVDALRRWGYK